MMFLVIILNLILLVVLVYKCKELFRSAKITFGLWFKTEKELELERVEMERAVATKRTGNENESKTNNEEEIMLRISDNDCIMLVFCCLYSSFAVYSLLFGILSMAGYVYYCLDGKNYFLQS